MTDDFINPNSDVNLECTVAFMCDSLLFDSTNVSIRVDNIYFAENTNVDLLPPTKAPKGEDAQFPGTDGGNGQSGEKGRNLYIHANTLLKGSKNSFIFTSRGGDGGDGGKGAVGEAGHDGANGDHGIDGTKGSTGNPGVDVTEIGNEQDPLNADAVYAEPTKKEIDSHSHSWTHWIDGVCISRQLILYIQ